ncbi:hypothetical protein [Vibrio phage VCPH]|nr:hypothetical protein [Vibrio phage VCPH]
MKHLIFTVNDTQGFLAEHSDNQEIFDKYVEQGSLSLIDDEDGTLEVHGMSMYVTEDEVLNHFTPYCPLAKAWVLGKMGCEEEPENDDIWTVSGGDLNSLTFVERAEFLGLMKKMNIKKC